MASIVIDPGNKFIRLVCGAGETSATFQASAIFATYVDWFHAEGSQYDPAMDSEGGAPVDGSESLGSAYFVLAVNGWAIAIETVEPNVKVVLEGDLFPRPTSAELFDYSLAAGHTHIERRTSTLPTIREVGTSGLTPSESTQLSQAAALSGILEDDISFAEGLRIILAFAAGEATVSDEVGSFAFRDVSDSKNRIAGTRDENGNRLITTRDGS